MGGSAQDRFLFRFLWDPGKARSNRSKHGIAFEDAATVLHDPLALSRYDHEHSDKGERWITLGRCQTGGLLVVIHTYEELTPLEAHVRIISARPATAREQRCYETRLGEPTMKDEYDFSNAQRGKFFHANAGLDLPVYLDNDVREYLSARARAQGIDVNQLVNELLKRDIASMQVTR